MQNATLSLNVSKDTASKENLFTMYIFPMIKSQGSNILTVSLKITG